MLLGFGPIAQDETQGYVRINGMAGRPTVAPAPGDHSLTVDGLQPEFWYWANSTWNAPNEADYTRVGTYTNAQHETNIQIRHGTVVYTETSTPTTLKLLSGLKEDVAITYFQTKAELPAARDRMRAYELASPHVKVEFVDPLVNAQKQREFCGLPVVEFETLEQRFPPEACHVFVAVGFRQLNRIRARLFAAAKAKGFTVEGPYPSDTVFLRARNGDFDAVLTMYHDQGQIAMKLMGFDRGVTLIGGFPFPICTPAHGTAYEIAGKGIANLGATRAALALAIKMAGDNSQRRAAA